MIGVGHLCELDGGFGHLDASVREHQADGSAQFQKGLGKKVRSAIEEIGGTMPENIPPAEPIKNVEKRLKKSKPKLELGK